MSNTPASIPYKMLIKTSGVGIQHQHNYSKSMKRIIFQK
eukprot:UN01226